MDRADEIVPRMACGQVANPVLVTGQVIDLQRELDDQPGMVAPGALDPPDILVQLRRPHAPVVEIVEGHRIVIGEPDFLEAQPDGLCRQFGRLARGVATKWRVRMVVCG